MSDMSSNWTSPSVIRAQLLRLWDSGRLLAAHVNGSSMFPWSLNLRQPGTAILGEHFDEVRRWIRQLDEGSKSHKGRGYVIEWRDINHRQLGRNRMPASVVVVDEADALWLIGKVAEKRHFEQLSALTLRAFPVLAGWIARRPMLLLEHAAAWERIVLILQWFVAHPRPQRYVRELDIPGVDSKFIETRKALLAELLDQLLPSEAVDVQAVGTRQFEMRYGLLSKPVLIRFRLLDAHHYIGGLSDLSVPVAQFAALRSAVKRVFITENEINGLAFPEVADSMVIFGGGYAVDRLGEVPWLVGKEVIYWGDIDTHGFAILDRLRGYLPQARSMLMDIATLETHRLLWGREEPHKRHTGDLTRLTDEELALFHMLRDNTLGERIRMEQERLGFHWVRSAI
ncbi:Wadjet anti-phage system protein JetD domain-containing protein [Janthinobacterium sp. JC611]|uniref:Wadjet anti-phage system protein JetD domain-containing protein n=1 Tax=Janthinobacterium sp. JC611 TaxID=2816201 RepID=UPI001BFD92B9|nr:Wadjet anti-phage system protein JetD domain-containing protein [Janthinobacterium sp. JC611]